MLSRSLPALPLLLPPSSLPAPPSLLGAPFMLFLLQPFLLLRTFVLAFFPTYFIITNMGNGRNPSRFPAGTNADFDGL